MPDMNRLNTALGILTLLYGLYIGMALWYSHRREATRRAVRGNN